MSNSNREMPLSRRWIDAMEEFGIKKKQFDSRKKEIARKQGIEPNDRDVLWSLFNEHIGKLKDYHQLKMLYYSMALFLNEEGRDCFKLLRAASEMDLRNFQQEDIVEKVKILDCGSGSCPACQKQRGRILSIKEALEAMPIPNKECTFVLENGRPGFCRCSYVAVI